MKIRAHPSDSCHPFSIPCPLTTAHNKHAQARPFKIPSAHLQQDFRADRRDFPAPDFNNYSQIQI
jgi:hypothetical protein